MAMRHTAMRRTAMRHTFSILLTMCILMLIGAALAPGLDIGSEPRPERGKTLSISYWWGGKSAKVVEQNVTSRIEALVSSVRGVESVSSVSRFGSGNVEAHLKKTADVSSVKFEIASLLRQMRGKLPSDMSYPSLSGGEVDTGHDNDAAVQVLSYQVFADMPDEQIRQIVEREVKPKMEHVEGVQRVDVTGGTTQYMEIAYDARSLAVYGVTGYDIAEAVRSFAGREDVVGSIAVDAGHVIVPLLLSTAQEMSGLEKMPVKMVNGKTIYLNDMASCTLRQRQPDEYYRMNGMNTIYLNVYAEKDASVVKTVGEVKRLAVCPPMTFKQTYDRAEEQLSEFHTLVLRSSATLVILLLFVWLSGGRSWRYLGIVACTLAANVLLAVIIYRLLDLRLHPFSMAGITVSLGIIIDSTIVMVDHYGYYRDRKAFLGILAAMLTTIGSLVVVFWLPDSLRRDLKDFSIIVMVNLAVALVVALLFAPALVEACRYSNRDVRGIGSRRKIVRFTRWYEKYVWVAQHKVWRWGMLILFAGFFAGALKLFADCLDTNAFRPKDEEMRLHIQAKMPLGGSVHELNDKVKEVEAFLAEFDKIKRYETSVSWWGATIDVSFKEDALRTSFPFLLENKVIGKVVTIGGADWSTYGVSDRGFSNSLNLQYRENRIEIAGYDYDRLYRYAEDICKDLRRNPRVADIIVETPGQEHQEDEIYMEYDNRMLALDSVRPEAIHSSLHSMLAEADAGDICVKRQGKAARFALKTHAVVRPAGKEAFDLWQLKNAYVETSDRSLRPNDFMAVNRREAKNCIPRENQEYVLRVAFNVIGSYSYTSRYIRQMTEKYDKLFPVGFRCLDNGFWDDEADGTQYWLIGLVAVIIFWICAMLFESFMQALTVVLLIPVSFIGLFLSYWITGVPFGTGGFAAMVLLCGLTVNAGIYIICEYRNSGSYIRAFNHKIVPIMLTILSTVLGMIPFLIDGSDDQPFWYSLAVGTVGGLAFSMLPLLFFMPLTMKVRSARVA